MANPGPPARRSATSVASGVPAATRQLRVRTRTVVADAVTARGPDRIVPSRPTTIACTSGPDDAASAGRPGVWAAAPCPWGPGAAAAGAHAASVTPAAIAAAAAALGDA